MKTPKELMIAAEPYQAMGKELFEDRQKAKELVYQFNLLKPAQLKARNQLIKQLFGKTGNRFFIEPPFRCDYGYNIEVGENFYANYNLTILDGAAVKIGDNVLLGPNVGIYTASHPVYAAARNAGWEYCKPICIEDNVWIGAHAVILPGVSIGRNTVIGAGSVVTKDIPEGVVAVGNPCQVLREITEADRPPYYSSEP